MNHKANIFPIWLFETGGFLIFGFIIPTSLNPLDLNDLRNETWSLERLPWSHACLFSWPLYAFFKISLPDGVFITAQLYLKQ